MSTNKTYFTVIFTTFPLDTFWSYWISILACGDDGANGLNNGKGCSAKTKSIGFSDREDAVSINEHNDSDDDDDDFKLCKHLFK